MYSFSLLIISISLLIVSIFSLKSLNIFIIDVLKSLCANFNICVISESISIFLNWLWFLFFFYFFIHFFIVSWMLWYNIECLDFDLFILECLKHKLTGRSLQSFQGLCQVLLQYSAKSFLWVETHFFPGTVWSLELVFSLQHCVSCFSDIPCIVLLHLWAI